MVLMLTVFRYETFLKLSFRFENVSNLTSFKLCLQIKYVMYILYVIYYNL